MLQLPFSLTISIHSHAVATSPCAPAELVEQTCRQRNDNHLADKQICGISAKISDGGLCAGLPDSASTLYFHDVIRSTVLIAGSPGIGSGLHWMRLMLKEAGVAMHFEVGWKGAVLFAENAASSRHPRIIHHVRHPLAAVASLVGLSLDTWREIEVHVC